MEPKYEEYLIKSIKRQKEFWEGERDQLYFSERSGWCSVEDNYSCGSPPPPPEILSLDYLKDHAYDLGIRAVKRVESAVRYHSQLGDDWHPYLNLEWGTGFTASMISNRPQVFEKGTSYEGRPVLNSLEDVENLVFNPDNPMVQMVLDYWKGVGSVLDSPHIAVGLMYRSPLDVANAMRGNDIFYDLYDNPEGLDRLVDHCARSIIELDRLIRSECPFITEQPGGVWGTVWERGSCAFLNGDPIDMIAPPMADRYNTTPVEKIVKEVDHLFFHHHSLGWDRYPVVNSIEGLAVQEIIQDPNGFLLPDIVDANFIAASHNVPIKFDVNLKPYSNYKEIIDSMKAGRFLFVYKPETVKESRRVFDELKELD